MSDNPLRELLNEFMNAEDEEDISLSLGEIIICINYRNVQLPPLSPEEISRLITAARDWSTCESDPDYHNACTAIHALGLFRPDKKEVYGLLEESLLSIDAPRCVQNHAARALGKTDTPQAHSILQKAKDEVSGWTQKKGNETFADLLDIIKKEIKGSEDGFVNIEYSIILGAFIYAVFLAKTGYSKSAAEGMGILMSIIKGTGLALIPLSAAGIIIGWIFSDKDKDRTFKRSIIIISIILLAAGTAITALI